MIGRLTGRIVTCSPGHVLVDVTGVGYDVHIPLSTFYAIAADTGSTVSLHVHTHVREDTLQLFGFASPEERSVFQRLIGISGVGPRMALAILSGIGVQDLRAAVFGQDRERLQKIPGVGKKTAERLLLELRDRLAGDGKPPGDPGGSRDGTPDGAATVPSTMRADAVSALTNLGYGRDVAARAVDRAMDAAGPRAKIEDVLRTALAGLVR